MKRYTVRWEGVFDAEDETDAARQAFAMVRDDKEFSILHVIEDRLIEAWPEAGWCQMDIFAEPEEAGA